MILGSFVFFFLSRYENIYTEMQMIMCKQDSKYIKMYVCMYD